MIALRGTQRALTPRVASVAPESVRRIMLAVSPRRVHTTTVACQWSGDNADREGLRT